MKNLALLATLCALSAPSFATESFAMERLEQLGKECDKNRLDSCVQFGIWIRDYMESPADAVAPVKKACDGGHMKGCNVLGNLYLNEYSGLGMDAAKARALYQRACNGGYANACANLDNTPADASHTVDLDSLAHACAMENDAACRAHAIASAKQKPEK